MRLDPKVVKALMQAVYSVIKLLPTNPCKVVFLSRQANVMPLDFELLIKELRRQNPSVRIVAINQRLEENLGSRVRYAFILLVSLFYLATSKVAVLDSYWPAVSALKHKKSLVVFQMWHAMGKLKKSGKATVGMPSGRDQYTSTVMGMHEGYDHIVAGAPGWNPFYMESFGVSEDVLLNIGLPRADYLVNDRQKIADRILAVYPELLQGTVVLYAPTFRTRNEPSPGAQPLVKALAPAGYKVIVKSHHNQELLAAEGHYWTCPEFTALELLTVADYLVTDYSAISIEAGLIDVRTLYYLYDFDEYVSKNGLNIDYHAEVPNLVCNDAQQLLAKLEQPYPVDEYQRFKAKYVLADPGHSAKDLADVIFKEGGLCTR